MKKGILTLLLVCVACTPQETDVEVAAWEAQAQSVTIIRDDWGIPHIYGETDADAVFGMIYAQAEDDFNRIEVNFLNSQGRLAEAEGEDEIWRDLRMKLFIDPADMQTQYDASPQWLKDLMDAWASGLNYYLYTHPEVQPRVLTRFEPWMALTFSEGSIGGDIERVNLGRLEAFYGQPSNAQAVLNREPSSTTLAMVPSGLNEPDMNEEPTGSNGIAIAPANTSAGNALLLINPHTSFFFREELHMVSEQGLDAYGAVTWGQFFVYQGFNENAGWMHTSSGVDNIDEFLETVVERDGTLYYRYGDEERPVTARQVTVPYKTDTGMAEREFTVYRTHHGPIVREVDGAWVSVALMEEPMDALIQSYMRTKAQSYDEYIEVMRTHTNSSNNTVFADSEGNIAYLHSNFIPVRDTRFNYLQPVDGSDPATDWQGVHSIEETPNAVNPSVGWLQNTNNWPFSAAGPDSPRREEFPVYVQRSGENARGLHAMRVLEGKTDFTLQSLIDAAFDSYLTGFEELIPALVRAYDQADASNPLKAELADQVSILRDWDLRWSVESIPTSLAIFFGEETRRLDATEREVSQQLLQALSAASARLEADFGSWRTPWGDINRFQRLTGDIVQPFDDAGPSTPVGFPSARWGSLASFGARAYPQTKKWYGTSGNSFVAVVEFGDEVRARAVTAGGLDSDPSSQHFNDQAELYATGDLREVYYYRADVEGHIEREYHPGN
ncbi:MAG TPA: acylase [Gemmatimonadetes bacterium]|nr:acylase [Gemmatimonadota bacterium]|tara:strand:+ start:757 stop:2931 length:2175 start_codon:yes stop_codon:yes gene_type:complete